MYTAPEVRELGAVSAFTLGSSHGVMSTTKANNSNLDQYDAVPGYQGTYGTGTPCTTQLPLGTYNCS